jgi:hypothetical protein
MRKKQVNSITIKLGYHEVAHVEEFCYLGSRITNDGRSKKDIVSRRAQAKKAFQQKRSLFTAKNISLEVLNLKKIIYHRVFLAFFFCFSFPIFLKLSFSTSLSLLLGP